MRYVVRGCFFLSLFQGKGREEREGPHRITIKITDSRIHDISNAYSGRITSSGKPLQKTACQQLSPFRRRQGPVAQTDTQIFLLIIQGFVWKRKDKRKRWRLAVLVFGSDDGDELVDEDEDENVEFDDYIVEADDEENIAEDFEEEKKG